MDKYKNCLKYFVYIMYFMYWSKGNNEPVSCCQLENFDKHFDRIITNGKVQLVWTKEWPPNYGVSSSKEWNTVASLSLFWDKDAIWNGIGKKMDLNQVISLWWYKVLELNI